MSAAVRFLSRLRLSPALRRTSSAAPMLAALLALISAPANATKIERVVSPGGIEAWLVRETSVPVIALEFAFGGGANQDPVDKPGVANLIASLLDEGAGDLDAKAFSEWIEDRAIHLRFSAGRDQFRGSLRTLAEHRDEAFDLLRLAITAPRFDAEAVERMRSQALARLRRETTNPNDIGSRRWMATAFPDHPYGRPVGGTLDSVPRIDADDLRAYVRRVFAKDRLKIAIVGDIDAAAAGALIDKVFGTLPAHGELAPVAAAGLRGLGQRIVVDLDVPQTLVTFIGPGVARHDPDFFAAYVLNHILGGGVASSRLYREVRAQRGLVYGISSSLVWLEHAALLYIGTATSAERAGETLAIIEQQLRSLAENGPSEDELAKAKAYLKGSYALGFDTSAKIAGQLLQIQIDDLGIDYVDRRGALIDAVTVADARRVAKRLLDGGMLVTVVGRSRGLDGKDQGG